MAGAYWVIIGADGDGPLHTIPSSTADGSDHGPEAAAAIPAARHRRCRGSRARNRHGSELPLYGDAVEEVIGVDVSPELLAMAERAAQRRDLRVRLLEGSAEHLPSTIADGSVDTVVVTWALCSIPDATAALVEAHRELRPMACFASSNTGDLPTPRWLGGRTVSPRFGGAARAAVI